MPALSNEPAESALLGALLANPATIAGINGRLKPGLFICPFNARVMTEIRAALESGQTPDLPTMTMRLHGRADAPPDGWALLLTDLATAAALPHQIETALAQLERSEAARRLVALKQRLAVADVDEALGILASARDDIAAPMRQARGALETMAKPGTELWVPWGERDKLNRPVVVEGHLREGEVMEIAGGAKGRKTWVALDLARAVASGGSFLGRFQCSHGNVLYFDYETTEEAMRFRLSSLATSTEAGRISLYSLRQNPVAGTVEALDSEIRRTKAALAVVDCLYAVPGFPEDENSNSEVAAFRRRFVSVAEANGCAVVLLHHTGKGGGLGRDVVDRGRGGSAGSAVVDTMASLTADGGGPGYLVWERAARTFAPEAPLVVTFDTDAQPWEWAPTGTAPVTPKQGPPQKVTDADLIAAVGSGATLREILDRLPEPVDDRTLRRRLRSLSPSRLLEAATKTPTGADGPTKWVPAVG